MTCRMCRERGQTWKGDAPQCAFPNGGEFDAANWNCATANAIRDLCSAPSYRSEPHPEGVHHEYAVNDGCADQSYATIRTSDVDLKTTYADCLWVGWYKNRGRTEGMWLMGEGGPTLPTEADALAIIERYATGQPSR